MPKCQGHLSLKGIPLKEKKKRQFMEPGVGGGRGRAMSGKVCENSENMGHGLFVSSSKKLFFY